MDDAAFWRDRVNHLGGGLQVDWALLRTGNMKSLIASICVLALTLAVFDKALNVLAADQPNIKQVRTQNLDRQVFAAQQEAKFFKARHELKKIGLY